MLSRLFGFRDTAKAALRAQAEALAAAKAKRLAAHTAYCEAKARGDSRAMHEAHRSYRHATLDVMRLELGR